MLHEDWLRQAMLRVSPLEAEVSMDLPRLSRWALSDEPFERRSVVRWMFVHNHGSDQFQDANLDDEHVHILEAMAEAAQHAGMDD